MSFVKTYQLLPLQWDNDHCILPIFQEQDHHLNQFRSDTKVLFFFVQIHSVLPHGFGIWKGRCKVLHQQFCIHFAMIGIGHSHNHHYNSHIFHLYLERMHRKITTKHKRGRIEFTLTEYLLRILKLAKESNNLAVLNAEVVANSLII